MAVVSVSREDRCRGCISEQKQISLAPKEAAFAGLRNRRL